MKKRIILIIIGSILIGYSIFWTFLQMSFYFGWKILKDVGMLGHILALIISIFIGILILWLKGILIIKLLKNESVNANGKILGRLEGTLIDQIKKAHEDGKYESVIRFGGALSRHLFVEGFYQLRFEIGEIVEDSAAKLLDKESQAAALIDDIGWTLVLLRSNDRAILHIKHGLEIARTIPDSYWISKALRHMGAIENIKKNYEEAIKYMNKAFDQAKKIKNEIKKKEMIAGVNFEFAMAEYYLGNYSNAKKYCEESKKLRREVGDKTRICRIFALEGKVYEAENNNALAKDTFRHGLKYAEEINRKDEIIRNNLGLARILKKEGKIEEARKHLSFAQNILKESQTPFDIYGYEEIPVL